MAEIVIKLVNGELAGKTQQEINKQLSAANKELSKATIGTEAWVKANEKLGKAKTLQADLKKQIEGTTAASNTLKNSFGGVLSQIPGFSQLSGFLGQAKGGVGGLTSAFGLLRGAIAATGIGALLLIVVGLISALKNFTPLIDKVEVIFGGISAVVSELIQRFQQFASGLWDFITGTPGGIDKMSSSFDGLADSIKSAYEAGAELATLQQDLDDALRGIQVTNAKQSAQIDRMILQSKNLSLSLAERNKLLQDAKKIAEDNFKANDEIDKKSLDLLLKKAALDSKLSNDEILRLAEGTLAQEIEYAKRGNISDDLLEEIVAAQVKVIDGEGRNNVLMEKIINREAQIREKAQADREKAEREAEKKREAAVKAEEKRLKEAEDAKKATLDAIRDMEDREFEAMEEGRAKDLAAVKLNLSREVEEIQASGILVAERRAAAIDVARQAEAKINAEWDQKDLQKRIEKLDLELATEQNGLIERYLARQITEGQFTSLSAQNVINYKQRELDIIRDAHGEQSQEYQRAYAEFLQLQVQANAQAEAEQKKHRDNMVQAVGATAGVFGNLFSTIASFQEQGTAQWKSFATTAAILSAIQGAINAYTSTAAIPVVGAALAPVAAGVALAAGMANVKKIRDTKVEPPTKAARGMVLKGPSHAQGGIPIEAEGDEIILAKGVYRNPQLRAAASELNYLGGGIRFEIGGPVNPFLRSSSSRSTSTTVSTGDQESLLIQVREELRGLRAEVAMWPKRLKVINVVSETLDGIEVINQIQDAADV